VSGVLLFLALPLLLWMFELSLTSELSYERLRGLAGSVLVKLVLVALAWAFLHHLVAGIRFLVLDLHLGVDKQASANSARAVLVVSVLLAAAVALKIFGVF
jgi:succinate dehydrogenase / fumarate reductase cytochrome b subunit